MLDNVPNTPEARQALLDVLPDDYLRGSRGSIQAMLEVLEKSIDAHPNDPVTVLAVFAVSMISAGAEMDENMKKRGLVL